MAVLGGPRDVGIHQAVMQAVKGSRQMYPAAFRTDLNVPCIDKAGTLKRMGDVIADMHAVVGGFRLDRHLTRSPCHAVQPLHLMLGRQLHVLPAHVAAQPFLTCTETLSRGMETSQLRRSMMNPPGAKRPRGSRAVEL